MTVKEVFELRDRGLAEQAYEVAREIYATDKGPYASTALFWTAVDMLRIHCFQDHIDEAEKIYKATEHLLTGLKDEKGWMHDALARCRTLLLDKGEDREELSKDKPEHLRMGAWGEELAAAYLREKGYVILERDWHSKHRDIDIIAQYHDCLVFVEVKTRHNQLFTDPLSSINYKKQQNIQRAINHYIRLRKWIHHWRFDVITIVGEQGVKMPEINHVLDFTLDFR